VGLVHGGGVTPISRYFPRVETWDDPDVAARISRFADHMPQHVLDELAEDEVIESLLDMLAGDDENRNWADYRNFVAVGIKPFMDAHTFDQDRIDQCCVHIVSRSGEPISFCEYNAVNRPLGQL
jgi:uncharacterized radical SAM superfamily Fe-S cluster-containing enzyme